MLCINCSGSPLVAVSFQSEAHSVRVMTLDLLEKAMSSSLKNGEHSSRSLCCSLSLALAHSIPLPTHVTEASLTLCCWPQASRCCVLIPVG